MHTVAHTYRYWQYDSPLFAEACLQVSERVAPIRPIHGATLTVRGFGPDAGRTVDRSVILLARDATGYANLCSLITTAHMAGERGDPALTTSQMCERAGGLIALLGPESEPGSLAAAGMADAAGERMRPWREAFGRRDLFA